MAAPKGASPGPQGQGQGKSVLLALAVLGVVLGAGILDWDLWASGTCVGSSMLACWLLLLVSTKSARWRKTEQPVRQTEAQPQQQKQQQQQQQQEHQQQQEQRQDGNALASPCGRSLAGSDYSRSSDVLSLFLASSSSRSSLGYMRARANKDGKLTYSPQTRRTHVAVKIHHKSDSITPERLSENAIMDLCAQVQNSVPNSIVLNAAVRQGCVAISFDVCRYAGTDQQFDVDGDFPAHALSQANAELAELVQGAAMNWARQMGISGNLEQGTSVVVQAGTNSLKCTWDEGSQTWRLEGREDLAELRSCRLDVSSPVLLLSAPPAPQDATNPPETAAAPLGVQQAQQQQQLPGQVELWREGPAVRLTFHVTVRTPMSGGVVGWQGSETQGNQSQHHQLLARVRGRFLAVEVKQLGHEKAEEGDSMHAHQIQVQVCVPPEVAHSGACFRLQLELLYQGRLACTQALLLVPGHLLSLAMEVQGLAVSEETQQAQTYISDLTDWLQLQGIASAVAMCIRVYEGVHGVTRSGRLMREDSAMETDADVSLANLGPTLNVLSPRGGWGGSEAAVSAEAARPEATHLLVHSGQELLNCAVAWGMPAVAEQLLKGLMNVPCSLHFRTLAAGLDAAREETEGNLMNEDDASQGCLGVGLNLLGLAIMSGSPAMLSKVLGWGHKYGGPGFCWCKGFGTAAGDSATEAPSPASAAAVPATNGAAGGGNDRSAAAAVWEEGQGMEEGLLSLVQALPLEDPCLGMLLADPVEGPLVSEALGQHIAALRLVGVDAANTQGQSGGGGGHNTTAHAPMFSATPSHVTVRGRLVSNKLTNMCSTLLHVLVQWGLAIRLGGSSSSSRTLQMGCASNGPASLWQRRQQGRKAIHFLWAGIQGTFQGFEAGSSRSSSGDINENDFREWCHASNRRWAAGCCWTIMSCVAVAVIKSITHDRLSTDLPVLLLYGTPYLFVLNANKHAPQKRKVWMRTTKLCRLLAFLLMGMRITPVPVAICSLVEKHLEFITDLLIHRVADQVQLKALLLDRMTSTTAFFFLYSAMNLDHPFLRSLGLNLCSLCVGLILEARNRTIYLRLKNVRAKSK